MRRPDRRPIQRGSRISSLVQSQQGRRDCQVDGAFGGRATTPASPAELVLDRGGGGQRRRRRRWRRARGHGHHLHRHDPRECARAARAALEAAAHARAWCRRPSYCRLRHTLLPHATLHHGGEGYLGSAASVDHPAPREPAQPVHQLPVPHRRAPAPVRQGGARGRREGEAVLHGARALDLASACKCSPWRPTLPTGARALNLGHRAVGTALAQWRGAHPIEGRRRARVAT